MRTPSSDTLFESAYLRKSCFSPTSYRQTYLELPPARTALPSAEKAIVWKQVVSFRFEALERLERPPLTSLRPSMVPVCVASFASQIAIWPSSVQTASVAPLGLKARLVTSEPCSSTSTAVFWERKSHTRTVLSHEPDARKAAPLASPPKARHEIGPS